MKKRITSLLLALAMCFAMLPTAAFAAENTQEPTEPQEPQETQDAKTWGDKADTSWYVAHETDTEYHITTAEQLAGLAKLVNTENASVSFDGKTIYLDNDLDLAGYEWISIGSEVGTNKKNIPWYYRFNGTFDGRGHVIYNLYSHDSLLRNEEYYDGNVATAHGRDVFKTGLFGYLYKGTIKDLGIKNADIWIDPDDVSTYGEGILVDYIEDSTIENCWTTGSITGGSYFEQWIGGVVGSIWGDCKISGCYSSAKIEGNYLGHGYNVPDGADPMDYPDSLGGIVGGIPIWGSLDISDCWFDGKISVNSIRADVGGIVGYVEDVTVKNCMVATTDMDADDDGNTCWVAYALDGTVEDNYWPDDEKAYDPSPLEVVTNGAVTNKSQGTAVSDFTSADVLAGLQANAAQGVKWVAGITHPTFSWDDRNIAADYSKVDVVLDKVKALNPDIYTNFDDVTVKVAAVDRNKSKAEQNDVYKMAEDIETAIANLQYKSADYTAVDAAIAAADKLNKDDYTDFSAVEAAVNAVIRGKNITEQAEVDAMADAINSAVANLQKKSSGGSSGGGSSKPSYPISTPAQVSGGSVSVTPARASAGTTVTVTVTPDTGYELGGLTVTDEKGNKLTVTDKGSGKYTFTMPSGKVTITPVFNAVSTGSDRRYDDVAETAWYDDAVEYVSDKGLMTGTGTRTFAPNASTTRGMLMTVLARYAGEDTANSTPWYQKGMEWAKANGVSDGTNPTANITREQLVAMLYRYAGSPAASGSLDNFSDASTVSSYAVNAMQWAVANGIVNGSNGKLNPKNNATRAEVAAILMRFCEMSK